MLTTHTAFQSAQAVKQTGRSGAPVLELELAQGRHPCLQRNRPLEGTQLAQVVLLEQVLQTGQSYQLGQEPRAQGLGQQMGQTQLREQGLAQELAQEWVLVLGRPASLRTCQSLLRGQLGRWVQERQRQRGQTHSPQQA